MKKLSIIFVSALIALASCTKSKEVHPEIGDGNDEIVTVGIDNVHVKYIRNDIANLQKVIFHYSLADEQQFGAAEMTKKSDCFELTLNNLESDTLYSYYYEVFPYGGNAYQTSRNTFHTQANDTPEPPTPPIVGLPAVATTEVSEITSSTAVCGGEVTDDGEGNVTARGVCWSTSANPTISDSHTTDGSGLGAFTSNMTGLYSNTTYHVRAYATNEAGAAYGLEKTFTTLNGGGGDVPPGAINGLFTINENGDQVYFSQGNLQYQASTDTWKFAENQWDYVGGIHAYQGEYGNVFENGVKCDNSLISPTYDGWIDLFGWGTSGWNSVGTYCHPWDSNNSFPSLYGPYGCHDLTGDYANADWGVYNPIYNGGNQTNQWRTLTQEEWRYVFNTRTNTSGIRYAKAYVNYVNGVILLPDDWNSSTYSLSSTNTNDASFSSNTLTATQWSILEQAGAVFLPAAGLREGTSFYYPDGGEGDYWSASHWCSQGEEAYNACFAHFDEIWLSTEYNDYRFFGYSVRLVQEAQ